MYIMSIMSTSVLSGTVSPRMEDNNCTIPIIALSYVRTYVHITECNNCFVCVAQHT